LTGIAEVLAKHANEVVESKGIKVHFSMDESGLLNFVNVELVLEKTSAAVEEVEGAFSKFGSTISKLFSGLFLQIIFLVEKTLVFEER
jgi:hypoxia up-regulated 1